MIEILSKNKARLRISVGSGEKRKVYTKTVTYSGKRDLERQHAEFRNACVQKPIYDLTLKELIESYIASKEAQGFASTTIRGYRVCQKRITADLGGVKASELLPIQIDDYIAQNAKKYSPKTIRNDISLINASYERAIKLGLLKENPCRLVTLPKQTQDEVKILSEEDIATLLVNLDNERIDYKVGYELCLFCGLRRSEVLGLTEDDVDFNRKIIHINKTRHSVSGEDVVQPTKTVRSHRTLAVPDFILEDIQTLFKTHNGYDFVCSKYLICTEFGEPISPSVFTNHFRLYVMPGYSVHALRHTFATLLNAQGIDIARISAELGHSNITTTLNKYTHVFGDASSSSRGIANQINDLYGK